MRPPIKSTTYVDFWPLEILQDLICRHPVATATEIIAGELLRFSLWLILAHEISNTPRWLRLRGAVASLAWPLDGLFEKLCDSFCQILPPILPVIDARMAWSRPRRGNRGLIHSTSEAEACASTG